MLRHAERLIVEPEQLNSEDSSVGIEIRVHRVMSSVRTGDAGDLRQHMVSEVAGTRSKIDL